LITNCMMSADVMNIISEEGKALHTAVMNTTT